MRFPVYFNLFVLLFLATPCLVVAVKSCTEWITIFFFLNNFLSFWAIFCPFTPLTTQKIKILKKWKRHLEILSFYTSVQKIMIICYTVPVIWHARNVIFIFHFWLYIALFCDVLRVSLGRPVHTLNPQRHNHGWSRAANFLKLCPQMLKKYTSWPCLF